MADAITILKQQGAVIVDPECRPECEQPLRIGRDAGVAGEANIFMQQPYPFDPLHVRVGAVRV